MPRKKPDNLKMSKMVGVWCTQTEYDFFKKASEELETGMGTYVRKVALGEIPQKSYRVDLQNFTQQDILKLLNQLSKISNAYTQIGRALVLKSFEVNEGENEFIALEPSDNDMKKLIDIHYKTYSIVKELSDIVQESMK